MLFMAQILDLQKQSLPSIGMKIKSISERPILQVFQYRFCGTWKIIYSNDGVGCKSVIEYELIDIRWQDIISGKLIKNKDLLNLIQ